MDPAAALPSAPAPAPKADAPDPRAGQVEIAPKVSPDAKFTPERLMKMAMDGVNLDAAMDHLAAGGDLTDLSVVDAKPPKMDERRDQPRRDDGKFDGKQKPPEKKPDGTPQRFKTTAGKEYTSEQIELALQLADRSSRIDKAYEGRMAELRQREEKIAAIERAAEEGLSFRELFFNDPQRARQLYEATTGKRWPWANGAAPREAAHDDPDERAYERLEGEVERRTEEGEPPMTASQVKKLFKELRDQERDVESDQGAKNQFWSAVDEAAREAIAGEKDFEFDDDEHRADFLQNIGRRVGADIRLGQLVVPDLPRKVAGTRPDEVKRAVQVHTKNLLMREKVRLDKHSAKRLQAASEVAGSTPSSVRNAATMMPGVEQKFREETEIPNDIDGLIAQVTRVADEYERAGREAMEG